MLAACNKEKDPVVNVSINATAPSFINGKVDLIVSLSGQAKSAVSASLAVSGNIPESALTINKKVNIAAGSTTVTVPVTVNADALDPGDYESVFSISSVTGAEVNASANSCKVALTVEAPVIIPEVSIPSYSEAFDNNKASFKVALTQAIDSDVVVNFEVKTDLGEYEAVPAEALTFTNPVTIAAGATEVDVEVTVDPAGIAKGVSSFAVIAIASVSENATIASRRVQTYIEATSDIVANLRSDWSVTFAGEYTHSNGNTYHEIDAAGMGEDGTYYIFVYSKGVVADNFDTLSEYLQYMEESVIGPAIGTDNAYQIKQGEEGWLYYMFGVGEYEIWLMGCTANGHITGDYTTSTFEIEPTAELLEAYDKWLGDWVESNTGDVWTISEKVRGATFTITGVEGLTDYPIEGEINANGELEIYCQTGIADVTVQGTACSLGFYGIDGEEGYYWNGDYVIATGALKDDGTVSITPGTVSDGSHTYTLAFMRYIATKKEGSGGWYVSSSPVALPTTLEKPQDATEAYSKWIGNYQIERKHVNFDEQTDEPIDTVIVTDTWRVEAGVSNKTYIIYGMEDLPDNYGMQVKADFDEETGNMVLLGQKLGTWTSSQTSTTYTDYLYAICDDKYVRTGVGFTAKFNADGNVDLIPDELDEYNVIGIQYFYSSSTSLYIYNSFGYDLPNTLVPVNASPTSSSRKAHFTGLKNGMKKSFNTFTRVKGEKRVSNTRNVNLSR